MSENFSIGAGRNRRNLQVPEVEIPDSRYNFDFWTYQKEDLDRSLYGNKALKPTEWGIDKIHISMNMDSIRDLDDED